MYLFSYLLPGKRATYLLLAALILLLTACTNAGGAGLDLGGLSGSMGSPQGPHVAGAAPDACPTSLSYVPNCQTPQSMRAAYGLTSLIQKGDTGQGQTVVDIVSFGSPTLQQDIDVFDRQFGLPAITVPQLSPINEPVYDPRNDRPGWADETTLDVEIIHSLAPGAKIVVLTSPVAETEGTIGLPEFRQLLQYTIDHKLGNIVSQSFGASEATLNDAKGQAEIQKWDTLLKQATTQDNITLLASSGDNGATDFANLEGTKLAPVRTTSFPTDEPWVTSVGGTTLHRTGNAFHETAWNSSGGGFSAFYPQPTYQQPLPASVQSLMQKRRGVPDVSGDADPNTGMAMYEHGSWSTAGGTSASAPLWAALVAIADQIAGHELGFINPALYKIGTSARYHQDFNDITVGNNSVSTLSIKVPGYDAAPGWDPITGLGSPDAANLLPDLITKSQEVGLA